jgi:hypothetical protein
MLPWFCVLFLAGILFILLVGRILNAFWSKKVVNNQSFFFFFTWSNLCQIFFFSCRIVLYVTYEMVIFSVGTVDGWVVGFGIFNGDGLGWMR